jgi:hypothetical protein
MAIWNVPSSEKVRGRRAFGLDKAEASAASKAEVTSFRVACILDTARLAFHRVRPLLCIGDKSQDLLMPISLC